MSDREAHGYHDDEDLARTQEALEAEREAIDTAASELGWDPRSRQCNPLSTAIDTRCGELDGKPDGAWVTVGGMVRSRWWLEDLDERQVELIAPSEVNAAIAPGDMVAARGRVHRTGGETKLVVHEVQPL